MEENFKWRKISESERAEILENSKRLLNDFSRKLEKISAKETHFENEMGFRLEGTGWKTEDDFKDLMFLNAPFVEGDSIVAEKGGWK